MDGDKEDFWTFSAQTMIATLMAFLTCVMWNALRQVKLFNKAAPARTIERGIQSELDFPTKVYCSLGGECQHHVEDVRMVAQRADACHQEETSVYVFRTAKRTVFTGVTAQLPLTGA